MKTFFKRMAFKLLSDAELKELYQGVQQNMFKLAQQSLVVYWTEEGIAARMPDSEIGAWAVRQAANSRKSLDRKEALRRLIMESRPKLFEGHREFYLSPYNIISPFAWNNRPAYKKFQEIMAKREKNKPGYQRGSDVV